MLGIISSEPMEFMSPYHRRHHHHHHHHHHHRHHHSLGSSKRVFWLQGSELLMEFM
jgi:hypothetical protein